MCAQPGERELEADGEEQEHDADLGEHLDRLHLVHEREAVRSGQRARGEETGDRRQAQAREHDRDDHPKPGDNRGAA